MRHVRDQADQADHRCGDVEHLRLHEHLADKLFGQVFFGADAGDHDAGRRGDDQGRNLRNQAVTDGQQGVDLCRFADRQVVLGHADDQAADDVDQHDQDAGDGVAADELRCTVHRAEKVGFFGNFRAALAGLVLTDQAGVEVGVDRHLLAGHGVQREAGAHFGDAAGTLGDHHEVDDGEDDEHHDADGVVAADEEVAEGLDHLAGGVGAVVAVHQDDAAGGDVE